MCRPPLLANEGKLAAAIAELVLWIGYLQWHFRTNGSGLPPQPILKDFRNIECRDTLLAWDSIETVFNEGGIPASRLSPLPSRGRGRSKAACSPSPTNAKAKAKAWKSR